MEIVYNFSATERRKKLCQAKKLHIVRGFES